MAQNMFGDERKPQKLTFKHEGEHMYLFRGGKICGMVVKNGWTGKSYMINYDLGEPVLYNFEHDLSLAEMGEIQKEWKNNLHAN